MINENIFQAGDYVFLSSRLNKDWFIGESRSRKGLVPASFLRIISDAELSKHATRALVVKNFVARNELELDLIAGNLGIFHINHNLNADMFHVNYFYHSNEIFLCSVTLTRRVDDVWYLGHSGAGHDQDQHGLVSAHHVEIIPSDDSDVLPCLHLRKDALQLQPANKSS